MMSSQLRKKLPKVTEKLSSPAPTSSSTAAETATISTAVTETLTGYTALNTSSDSAEEAIHPRKPDTDLPSRSFLVLVL